jgi:hypothetical protein
MRGEVYHVDPYEPGRVLIYLKCTIVPFVIGLRLNFKDRNGVAIVTTPPLKVTTLARRQAKGKINGQSALGIMDNERRAFRDSTRQRKKRPHRFIECGLLV